MTLKTFKTWALIVLVVGAVLGGCGFLGHTIWVAMGTTVQQVVLGIMAVLTGATVLSICIPAIILIAAVALFIYFS